MINLEYKPGGPAPVTGYYAEMNLFGSPTENTIFVEQGDDLPPGPRGYTWRPVRTLPASELRARAAKYRSMAATASAAEVRDALLRLSTRYGELAGTIEC